MARNFEEHYERTMEVEAAIEKNKRHGVSIVKVELDRIAKEQEIAKKRKDYHHQSHLRCEKVFYETLLSRELGKIESIKRVRARYGMNTNV